MPCRARGGIGAPPRCPLSLAHFSAGRAGGIGPQRHSNISTIYHCLPGPSWLPALTPSLYLIMQRGLCLELGYPWLNFLCPPAVCLPALPGICSLSCSCPKELQAENHQLQTCSPGPELGRVVLVGGVARGAPQQCCRSPGLSSAMVEAMQWWGLNWGPGHVS